MRAVLHFTRRFVVATFSGLLITAVAAVVFWLLMGGWVATRMSSLANRHVFQDRMTRLHVGRVTGSVLSNIVFENVRLERKFGDEWRSAVYADQVEARYDVWALARGRTELSSIRVWNPLIEIGQDSTGRWILPVGRLPGERTGSGKSLLFSDIEIVRGRVRLNGRSHGWEAFNLDAHGRLAVQGEQVDLNVHRASFEMLEPVGKIRQLSGALHTDGPKIRGRDLRLEWEESHLTADFAWDPTDSLQGLQVNANLDAIPLYRLKGFFDADIIPTSGHLSGSARLNGGSARFDFAADLSGRYEDKVVDSLSVKGSRDLTRIQVDRLRLSMPECRILSGSGRVELARGGSLDASLELEHVQVDSIPLKSVRWIPGEGRGRLDLKLQRFFKGYGPIAAQVDIDFSGRRAFGVPLSSARGHIDHLSGRDVRITDVVLVLPDGGEIRGGGVLHQGDVLDFDFTATTSDWSQLRPVVAIPGLSGSGSVAGRLVGTSREPALEISGTFRNAVGWDMAADSLTLVSLEGPFSPEPRFEGTVEAENLRSLGRIIDHVETDFSWKEPRLTFPRLEATDNDTLAVTNGWTDFAASGEETNTVLGGGTLTIGHLTWTPAGPVTIESNGSLWSVLPARYSSAAGEAIVAADFQTDQGTMDARFSDMRIDLAVMAGEEKPPEFGGGMLSGDLRLVGPLLDPDPSGRLTFTDYRWDKAVVDSAFFDFRVAGAHLDLYSGWAVAGDGRLSFAGAADLPKSGWAVWTDWREKRPIAWEDVILDRTEVRTDGVSIERWAAWNPKITDLTGRAAGRGLFSGALKAPHVRLEAQVTGAARGGYQVDSLEFAVTYAPDRLNVERFTARHQGAVTAVSGNLPVRMSLVPAVAEMLEEPMDVLLDIPRGDMALLPLFATGIDSASGTLKGRVRIRGTPRHYLAYGDLDLAGGRIRLKDREEVVENLNARVRFDSTTVRLMELTGSQSGGGTLSGEGTFELGVAPERAYKIEIDLNRFVVRQNANFAARFDGHFELVPIRLSDGTVRPLIVGDIKLDRAEVIQEFDQPQAMPDPEKTFYYSLSIDAPRGIFIVNRDVDMELGGRITARRLPDGSELIGEMQIIRGYYTLLLRRFRITSGTINFNRVDVVDPEIDITAETNDGEYIISVHLSGQASNPVIEFAARDPNDPNPDDLPSKEEILRRLTPGGDLATSGESETEDSTDRRLRDVVGSVQLLFGTVQRDLARKLGVDEITVDTPGPEDQDILDETGRVVDTKSSYGKVGVSKWITPDVSVTYSQGIAGTQARDLSVEYRLGRLLFLRGAIINRNSIKAPDPTTTEYNVDLKLFHEY